tara:strand:+ start:1285 stop:1536 length:252 start_codon:yes stop_codon:yes gene_type:complete
MYIATVNLKIKNKEIKEGDTLDRKPAQWLLDQGLVVKVDKKKYQEEQLQKATMKRARNEKGHYIADDPNTPENEAWYIEKEEE